jgi:hypothetical protein
MEPDLGLLVYPVAEFCELCGHGVGLIVEPVVKGHTTSRKAESMI